MTWKFRTEKNLTYEIKCSEITGELQEEFRSFKLKDMNAVLSDFTKMLIQSSCPLQKGLLSSERQWIYEW